MNDDWQRRVTKSLAEIHSTQVQQMHRILACEGMLHSLLQVVKDPRALREIAEHFDSSAVRAAEQIGPPLQRSEAWDGLAATLANAIERLEKQERGGPASR